MTASSHNHTRCRSEALQKAELLCADKGLRFTDSRRRVLERVWASHRPVKAYEILKSLSDKTHAAKPPTVYRALEFLEENGLVHRLNTLNAYIGCGHPLQAAHACYFLICEACGEASECCDEALREQLARSAARQNFRLDKTVVEMRGLCAECQE